MTIERVKVSLKTHGQIVNFEVGFCKKENKRRTFLIQKYNF